MIVSLRRSIAAFAAVVVSTCVAPVAHAQSVVSYVWVQYESDGLPHARAIVAGLTCPMLVAGGTTTPMIVRSSPIPPAFPDIVCDLVLPAHGGRASVGGTMLPAIPRAPQTIAFFADTGCRLSKKEVQACDDPHAWPFPTIASDIAAAHPDLVVHVGDYYYREVPCPKGVACANSPHGDNAAAWMADYFAPMGPVFDAAPVVNVRGNHERCERGGVGWARYLASQTIDACLAHEPVASIAFDNLVLGVVDDATETTETFPNPAVFVADAARVDALAVSAQRETWLLAHRPPVVYEFTHQYGDTVTPHVALFLSGHIHTFGAYTLAGEAPQVLVGMGGDNLASDIEVDQLAVLGGVTDRRFGYALFTHRGNGWDIVVHDADTAVHRRCRLEARAVQCGPSLT